MERNTGDALGEVIKSARMARKLTREQFSELVGLSPRYIMSIENEKKKPAFDKLYRIIRALGVQSDAIFYPETAEADSTAQRLSRLLLQCSESDVKAITALVETLISERKQTDASK